MPGNSIESPPMEIEPSETRLGDLLRVKRLGMGLSVKNAAAEVGISEAHLERLEKGLRRNPSLQTAAKLSRRYGISLDYMASLVAQY